MNSIRFITTLAQRATQLLYNTVNVLSRQGQSGSQSSQSSIYMAATATLALFGIIYVAPRVSAYLKTRMAPVAADGANSPSSSRSSNRVPPIGQPASYRADFEKGLADWCNEKRGK